MMDKVTAWVQEHVVPVVGKFADMPYIGSIARSFAAFLPLTLLGSFTVLLGSFQIEAYQSLIQTTGLQTMFYAIYNLTVGLFAIWTAASLAYNYANALKLNRYAFIIALVNLLAYFIVTPYTMIESANYFAVADFGATGIFTVMLLTPIVVRVYKFCIDKDIRIKMPESVPEYIQNSFSSVIPALFISLIAYALLVCAQMLGYSSLTACVYDLIGQPLIWLASQPWATCFLFCLGFVMQSCFGIHGSVILSFATPILQPLMIANVDAFVAGETLPYMYSYAFFTYLDVQVVAHVIVMLMSRRKQFRELGKLCAFPSVFTVTEPVNFGVPMVFNPYLLIPNFLMPFINFFFVSALMAIGVLPYCRAMYVWGLPVLLNGYLQGGVMGIVAQLLVIALDVVIFLPFFRAYEASTPADKAEPVEA